ncbi:MAG: DUF1343 domain-containing protein [Acidobacteria bacterium]|nr:DUF1343 domain-containing protein [Acidobacteriota bacterium]
MCRARPATSRSRSTRILSPSTRPSGTTSDLRRPEGLRDGSTSLVTTGLERLAGSQGLEGLRVGLVCNPASVGAGFRHASELVTRSGARLASLFGPQHGFQSTVQDDMIETPHGQDEARRVPVYSLYSETREPTAAMLEGLDALVIDLPDVGTRIYTYVYTMANCLRAAHRHGLRVVVCDRPNPIGGTAVEGEPLVPGFESFVGQFPIPMRHGLTIGELARLFNERFGVGAELNVVRMEGWTRETYFDQTGLPWVMTSPNIPTIDTAIVYPGTVLFEGTNISEGRGTTRPFELLGAPWIQAERLASAMNARRLPGVFFRPTMFQPTFHKHARQPCGGVQVHVIDRTRFRPVLTGVALLAEFCKHSDGRFTWREAPYEYVFDKPTIDVLWGSDHLRRAIDAGMTVEDFAATWQTGEREFEKTRRGYLLY